MSMKKNLRILFLCCFITSILPCCNKIITKFDKNAINSKESPLFVDLVGDYVDISLMEEAGELCQDCELGMVLDSNGTCYSYGKREGCTGFKIVGKWAVIDSLLIMSLEKITYSTCDSNHVDSTKALSHIKKNVYKIKKIADRDLVIRFVKCLFCKDEVFKKKRPLLKL